MEGFWAQATLNTLIVIGGVVLLSLLTALPVAWLIERSDLPGRKALTQVLTLPYVIPSYLLAVAWITLANPDVGWLNRFFGVERCFNVYGLHGIVFIEASSLFSILFLTFRASLIRLDPSFEEAARLCGAGPIKTFFLVTLPILKNSIFLGVVAVGLASMASFGVPAMIGGPARTFVLTTGIYSLIKQGSPEGLAEAFSVALKMAIAALVIVGGTRFFSNVKGSAGGNRVARPAIVQLRGLRWPLSISIWTLWSIFIALPLMALLFSSLQSDPTSFALSNLGFSVWKRVLVELPDFQSAVINSLLAAAAAVAIVLAFSIGLSLLRWKGLYQHSARATLIARVIEEASFLVYSLPGTIIALVLLVGAAKFSFLSLSDTLSILILAYTIKYLSLGFNTLSPNALMIHPSLIEAARLSGAGFVARLTYIWLPLLRPALIAAGLLVFMPCLSELTMSTLLYGPSTQTLGVVLFEQQEYADKAAAAVVGSLLLLTVIVIQFIIGRTQREP